MLALYTATVLVSATLLFFVQPMFARMVLPLLGGSSAVWNTALVFFQIALLAGYGYVHFATSRLGVRRQVVLHLALMVLAFTCLPIAIPRGWTPPTQQDPIPWLLALMTMAIGLPFFVVSTTGPLMQRWLGATQHSAARDPYFLYAASNLGSLLGLLSYPLLLEPRLRIAQQSALWLVGYGTLAALTLGCAALTLRNPGRAGSPLPVEPSTLGAESARAERPTLRRRLRWLLLAMAPASLMMGVTTHITTDVAAIPLLWVVPLALYLLSFTLVFASRPPLRHQIMVVLLRMLVLPLILVMQTRATDPVLMLMALHLLFLFVAAMVCHGELARDRPDATHLTEFYLWLALGGALGGVFNALIAPRVFTAVAEYPIAIVLACLLAPSPAPSRPGSRARVLDLAIPLAIGLLLLGGMGLMEARGIPLTRVIVVGTYAGLAFVIYGFRKRPLRFALALAAILIANPQDLDERRRAVYAERSFFGINRVVKDDTGKILQLLHGTTVHGMERIVPLECREPLGYYVRSGPIGDVFRALGDPAAGRRVAVAGLGAGALAAYANAGERWTYYEIDPAVQHIATDPKLFCYLHECPAEVRVVLGDARLSLAATDERYDLMILDAYSSDAIPVHLLTREALRLYFERLAPHGVLVLHLSNRYFDLVPLVARLAADAGLVCRVSDSYGFTMKDIAEGKIPSLYAVVARSAEDLRALASDPPWKPARQEARVGLWTDDYSSLVSVFRRN